MDLIKQLKANAKFYVNGYYTRKANGNLTLHAIIYDPQTKKAIDSVYVGDVLGEVEDLPLPKEETKLEDESQIKKLSSKLVSRLRFNKNKKVNYENLDELSSSALAKDMSIPIASVDTKERAEEVFKLLEDTEVVTATRTKTTIKEAPAAIYVITKEQIKARGYRTLSDALHDVPGFDFQHTYGIYPELIHQRGLIGENNRTLVYIDGIPDSNLNENGVLAGTIRFPLNNVERIEVVSGPASALYGANAFNGIINIITKDGKTSAGNHIDLTYGYWEKRFTNEGYSTSFSSRGNLGEGKDSIQYSVGGYYYQTKGPYFGGIGRLDKRDYDKNDPNYYLETKACGGVCMPNSRSVGHYWSPFYNNSHEDTYNVTARLSRGGFRFQTVNWQYLQGEGTFANGTQQIDTKQRGLDTGKFDMRNLARLYGIMSDPKNIGTAGFIGSNWDFKNNSVTVGYLHTFSEKFSIDSELVARSTQILSSSRESYPNVTDPFGVYRPKDVTVADKYSRPDYAYQFEQRYQYKANDKNDTIVGFMARHIVAAKDYGSAERYTFNNYSGYVQHQFRPSDMFSFTFGFRYDKNTFYGDAKNPRFSVVFKPTSDLTLKYLYGSGFREPSSKELFTQTPQRKPNPGLKPELMQAHEIGIAYRFFKRYYVSSQFYHNKITNLILEVATDDTSEINGIKPKNPWNQNQNLGVARIYGAELETSLQPTKSFSVFFNYTYTNSRYEDLPASLQTSPSTRGRAGENPFDDAYVALYKELTKSPITPNGKNTVLPTGAIPNIAPHKFNLGFTYYIFEDFSVYLGLNYVDIRRTKATNPVSTVPGYTFVRLNIHKENFLYQGLYVQLHVNNLLNEQYFDPGIRASSGTYYPTMHPLERRNVWLTVGYKF